MDQINQQEFIAILKDVRLSYRLLALYQQRILDTIKYIGNQFNTNFESGWPKFSKGTVHGNRAKIDYWSWDWLNLYFYEFNMGGVKINDINYHFKIVHQADTGFYDKSQHEVLQKPEVDSYNDADDSDSRLFFILSKEKNGCPIINILEGNLTKESNSVLFKSDWLAVPYHLSSFLNKDSTNVVIQDFDSKCYEYFSIHLLNN